MTWDAFIKYGGQAVVVVTLIGFISGTLIWVFKPRVSAWFQKEVLTKISDIHHQTNDNHQISRDPTLHDRIENVAIALNMHLAESEQDRKEFADMKNVVKTFVGSQKDMWSAIEAVAKAEPPKD